MSLISYIKITNTSVPKCSALNSQIYPNKNLFTKQNAVGLFSLELLNFWTKANFTVSYYFQISKLSSRGVAERNDFTVLDQRK